MTELYKGYVPTDGKKTLMTFKGKTSDQLMTYEEVQRLPSYAGILGENTILIDLDTKEEFHTLLDIVDELGVKCRVHESNHGGHFLFYNNGMFETCKGKARTAIGLIADVKLGSKNSYEMLKLEGKEYTVVYDILDGEEYDTVPKWLIPIRSTIDFATMGAGDGRNQALFNYILSLQSAGFSDDEARECLDIINRFVLAEPLSESELKVIVREDAFKKPAFFKGKEFLFDAFARYIVANHHIIKLSDRLHIYKDGVYVDGYGEIEAQMIRHIPTLNRNKRAEVLAYLDLLIRNNSKASSPNFIAFKNGIYDIETDRLFDFSPEIIITNKINYDYNPSAYSPIVDGMLDKLAVHDSEVRALLEEVVGYSMYRFNGLRKAFILTGEKRNGKSTYLDMVLHLLGEDNTKALDLKELGDRFKTAELFGKLANIGDDIGDEFIANPAVFKKLVSGDRVNAERKGQDPFDYNNYAKLLFSANDIPRIKDKSGAVLDRLIIVPFDARFTRQDADFDPLIKYKLRASECMEYLILLGLNGLRRVIAENGFTTSKRVESSWVEYEETNNPILIFFKDLDKDADVLNQPTKTVYRRYSEYCLANNLQAVGSNEFGKQIRKFFGVETTQKRIGGDRIRIFSENQR